MVNPPLKKVDLNLIPAWRTVHDGKLVSGEGVNIAVLDLAADINHEDLRDRVYTPARQIPGSEVFVNTGMSFEKTKESQTYTHGTSVAGIVAATAGNGLGGRGVAYKANITSLKGTNEKDEVGKMSVFLSYVLKAGGFKIITNSMGNDFDTEDDPATYELFNELYEQNIAFIHAMGNEFAERGEMTPSTS